VSESWGLGMKKYNAKFVERKADGGSAEVVGGGGETIDYCTREGVRQEAASSPDLHAE